MSPRVLWWGDSPTAATGFGTVSRNVLAAMHANGWDITVLGVNYYSQMHSFPYRIVPASHPDPSDVYGKAAFIRALKMAPWDLVIVNNDTFVVSDTAAPMMAARSETGQRWKSIYYFPVDAKIHARWSAMIPAVDQAVAYSRFGLQEANRVFPEVRVAVIPHGCEAHEPITPDVRNFARKSILQVGSLDTFVWITVNRNSARKDIARTIETFAQFKLFQPDSILYAHCQSVDASPGTAAIDLCAAALDAGVLSSVAFPKGFDVASGGVPHEVLRKIYGIADGFITTHLGEGWGLTVTEAMAAGIPIVAPRNTTMPEILGENYPYLYDCNDTVWIDNSCYRPRGSVRDIFGAMKRLYDDRGTEKAADLSKRSIEFCQENSWEAVGKMWTGLIKHVMDQPERAGPVRNLVEVV